MSSNRRLSAIMFTDMVGYSAIAHRDESLADELLVEKKSLLEPLVIKHDGRIIKSTGDGFLIEFSSAQKTLQCAIEYQNILQSRNMSSSEDTQIDVRIGIHIGEVEERDGDIYGDGVNIAARIEPLANKGGIALSSHVLEQVRGKFRAQFQSLGTQNLKNIDTPIEVYQIDMQVGFDSKPSRAFRVSTSLPLRIGLVLAGISSLALIGWLFLLNVNPANAEIQKVVVLPFEDLSTGESCIISGESIAEQIINNLVRYPELQIFARNTALSVSEHDDPIARAKEIGADIVLEGSLICIGNELRVTAQPIRTSNAIHIWSKQFDRTVEESFKIIDEIADEVVETFDIDASALLVDGDCISDTVDGEAYNLYLQGEHFRTLNVPDNDRALKYFEAATEVDSSLAKAFAGMSQAYLAKYSNGELGIDDAMREARRNAQIALNLDENCSDAYSLLASVQRRYDRDFESAKRNFQRAIELNPSDAQAHVNYGIFLVTVSQDYEGAIKEWEEAALLDPLHVSNHMNLGVAKSQLNRLDEALEHYHKGLEFNPALQSRYFPTLVLERLRRWEDAIESMEVGKQLLPDFDQFWFIQATTLLKIGETDKAYMAFDEGFHRDRTAHGKVGLLDWYLADRKFEEAIELANQSTEDDPNDVSSMYRKGFAHFYLKDYEEAIETMELALEFAKSSNNPGVQIIANGGLGMAYAALGNDEIATEKLNLLIDWQGDAINTRASMIAAIYLVQGNDEKALSWLAKAADAFEPWITSIRVDPLLDPFRNDPRYLALVEKMGL